MDHPSLGVIGDDRLSRLVGSIPHADFRAHLESFVNPLQNAFPRHLQDTGDLTHRLPGRIKPQDLRALNIAESSGLRMAQLIQVMFLFVGKDKTGSPGSSSHG
jgi:hypothetical protein